MVNTLFNEVVRSQVDRCLDLLITKGKEYAPAAVNDKEGAPKYPPEEGPIRFKEEPGGQLAFDFDSAPVDRLHAFKKAAVIMNATPKAALLGMLSKHLVSVSDMCISKEKFSLDRWNEKITDTINYLLILRAMVEEEANEQN